jgi:hypothetical protein
MSNFPTELDPLLPTPGAGESLGGSSPTHPEHHTELEARTRAIQLAVGKSGSADTASIEYRLAGVIAAADAAASAAADAAADAISALANAALASSDLADHEADTGAHDIAATVATAIAAHEAVLDPHGAYPLEADLGTAAFLDAGTAVGDLVQVQAGGALPPLDASALLNLPASGVTDHGALTGLADDDHGHYHTDARGDARYAPIAKGVTGGDAHNHDGGDGAQIAYTSLSGLPTLGSAAAAATGDFEASGAVSTHNAVATAHGISAWGATLVDDVDASTARSTLGLGTAATTASTAYATSTQGANADSHASNTSNPHAVSKTQVGLGSVDNTSDASKPVSTAQQTALNLKANLASPTFTGTVVGITAAMVGAPSGSGTSTGANTGNETTTTVGALLNSATSKTTPVDADQIGLMDSEASNVWKKLSWANLKTALYTALFGTAAPSAKVHITNTTEQLRCGYDAANYLGTTVNSSGVAALEATGGQYTFKGGTGTAPLGSELVTNGTFASSISGWTDSGATWSWSSGTALHTAGSASTLSQSVTVTSGTSYQLEFVMVGRTTGSVTVTLGSVTAIKGGTTAFTTSTQVSLAAADSGSVTLSIVPTADFNGSLDNVTLKSIGVSLATMRLLNSSGSVVCEIRANSNYNNATGHNAQRYLTTGNYNNATGYNAQRSLTTGGSNNATGHNAQYSLTTGSYNNATGYNAQYSLTTGGSNNATGYAAQYSLTTGGSNNATGYNAQRYLTTGSYNNATGYNAQYSLTTGSYNNATGYNAQYSLTTGGSNNATGYNAQRYLVDGVTAATAFSGCTHIGDGTRVSADSVTNETAIGSGATGIGSNTCTIGNSSVTRTGLRGSVEVIADSSTTIAQSQAGLSASWVDSTHSTRKARGVLTAWDYSGGREAFRFEADGTQIKTSVNGVPAAARAAALTAEIPGDATRDELRLTELYNACKNFGIIN